MIIDHFLLSNPQFRAGFEREEERERERERKREREKERL